MCRSRHVIVLLLLPVILGPAVPAWGQSTSSSFTLEGQRVGAGGGPSSSGTVTQDAATGQSASGPSSSTSFRNGAGFLYQIDPGNAPLPVELTAFEATQAGASSVELTWTTASETNNAGFRVQHKSDVDGAWSSRAFVESRAGGGTTEAPQTYRFTAEDLAVGIHRFRLKQIDLDGTEHVHEPVTVELQMQEALHLTGPAPNPVRRQATLSFAIKEQTEATITLYNTLGQRVRTVYRGTPAAAESQTARLSTTGLSSGPYFLRLRAGGDTATRRVTVVK